MLTLQRSHLTLAPVFLENLRVFIPFFPLVAHVWLAHHPSVLQQALPVLCGAPALSGPGRAQPCRWRLTFGTQGCLTLLTFVSPERWLQSPGLNDGRAAG